jgi:hypothetical protein
MANLLVLGRSGWMQDGEADAGTANRRGELS